MSNYYAIAPYSSELYHHGIKGQKWGVRRYQNPDGSLTEAGKKRVNKLNARVDREHRGFESRQRRIIEKYRDNDGAKAIKKVLDATDRLDWSTRMKDIKKEEIRKYGTYVEREIEKSAFTGQLLGGVPLNVAFTMIEAATQRRLGRYVERDAADEKLSRNLKDNKIEYANMKKREALRRKTAKDPVTPIAGMSKHERLNLARKNDKYDLRFLENMQNSPKMDRPRELLKDYERYLDDPERFLQEMH